jgi:hypothetical protein
MVVHRTVVLAFLLSTKASWSNRVEQQFPMNVNIDTLVAMSAEESPSQSGENSKTGDPLPFRKEIAQAKGPSQSGQTSKTGDSLRFFKEIAEATGDKQCCAHIASGKLVELPRPIRYGMTTWGDVTFNDEAPPGKPPGKYISFVGAMVCIHTTYECCSKERNRWKGGADPRVAWKGSEIMECMRSEQMLLPGVRDILEAADNEMMPELAWQWEGAGPTVYASPSNFEVVHRRRGSNV